LNITGTVESTCAPTPFGADSSRRIRASQQFASISRKNVPSSRTMRARQGGPPFGFAIGSSWMKPCAPNLSAHLGSTGGNTCV